MINKVILVGRLVREPELRYTPNGTATCGFTLAVDRRFSKEKETDFINIVVWKQLAELCANHLKKGQQAAVEGRIQTRNYENKEGKKVFVTEVVAENVMFLGGGKNTETRTDDDDDPFRDDGRERDIDYSEHLPF